MKRYSLLVGMLLCVSTVSAYAAGDPAAGKQKSTTCAACHGPDGKGVNPQWPKLAGQNAQYLYKQLQDFKDKQRENPIMAGQVVSLSEGDMQDLAAYYASQAPTPGATDPDQLELGQLVYRGGNRKTQLAACIACHGPAGSGNPAAKFPRLSGQYSDYVAQQLRAYRDGSRKNDPAGMMRNVAAKMSDVEIVAVSQYIAGLHD